MKARYHLGMVWALAGILIWAGATKALAPSALAEGIANFRLVPWPLAVGLAFYVPWLELLIGVALFVPRWREGGAWAAGAVFVIFAGLWAITWARGINVTCGCFGGGGGTSAAWGLTRALVLAGAAWICARGARRRGISSDTESSRTAQITA